MRESQGDESVLLERSPDGEGIWYLPGSGRLARGVATPDETHPTQPTAWEQPFQCPITRLAFAVTMRCNLKCPFCYNRAHNSVAGLDAEVITRAIDDLAAQVPPRVAVGLIFSGGEPLLRQADVVAGIEHARAVLGARGNPVGVTLYTNATLLNADMVRAAREHGMHVMVSLDGPERIHNANRIDRRGQGGFRRTVRAIRMLQDAGLNDRLQARAVINSPDTSPADVLDAVLSEGITRMHLMPAYGTGVKLIDEKTLPRWLECLKIYELLLRRGVVIEVTPFWRIFRKLAYPKRFADSHFPCTAGRQMLGVGADGAYHLCHHYSGSTQRLGLVGEGLPPRERYQGLAPSVTEREPCRHCPVRHMCGGPCYHRGFIGGAPQTLEDCAEYIALLTETARTFVRLLATAPQAMAMVARDIVHIPNAISDKLRQNRRQCMESG